MAVFTRIEAFVAKQAGLCVVQGKGLVYFFLMCLHPRFIYVCFHPWFFFYPCGGKQEPISNPLSSSFSFPKSLLSLWRP